jgi:serine phosphatase RsbU (regulator of sigma subunit)
MRLDRRKTARAIAPKIPSAANFGKFTLCMRVDTLAPGDIFALYTDGITESFNQDREEFGELRLLDSLRLHRALSPRAALASVADEVLHFSPQEQHDDITLILAKCH